MFYGTISISNCHLLWSIIKGYSLPGNTSCQSLLIVCIKKKVFSCSAVKNSWDK